MFGDILIDKFQCYIPVNPKDKKETKELKAYIEGVLSKHYTQNAFKVNVSKNFYRLSFWFTPTRYYKNIKDFEQYTDTNLTMPEESELLSLFQELIKNDFFLEHANECKITKLDLTKNFLMKNPVHKYISELSQQLYAGRFKALFHISNRFSNTLSVTTLASKSEKSDKVGDREIILYDKVKELKRNKINRVYLKEPLSEEEKNVIPKWEYDETLQELRLTYLHILRVELQYGSSNKLSDLSKFLKFDDFTKGLYFKDFLGLLLNGELYEKLNNYYTQTIAETLLFNEDFSNTKLNVYQKVIQDNWHEVRKLPIDSVLKNNGLSTNYRKNLLKIQNTVKNPLIEELKTKIKGS